MIENLNEYGESGKDDVTFCSGEVGHDDRRWREGVKIDDFLMTSLVNGPLFGVYKTVSVYVCALLSLRRYSMMHIYLSGDKDSYLSTMYK